MVEIIDCFIESKEGQRFPILQR